MFVGFAVGTSSWRTSPGSTNETTSSGSAAAPRPRAGRSRDEPRLEHELDSRKRPRYFELQTPPVRIGLLDVARPEPEVDVFPPDAQALTHVGTLLRAGLSRAPDAKRKREELAALLSGRGAVVDRSYFVARHGVS